jgi:DNA repair exonuclease SbcCD ATPase subunit/DNA repair exonuclease SbcCD nuclease subunit
MRTINDTKKLIFLAKYVLGIKRAKNKQEINDKLVKYPNQKCINEILKLFDYDIDMLRREYKLFNIMTSYNDINNKSKHELYTGIIKKLKNPDNKKQLKIYKTVNANKQNIEYFDIKTGGKIKYIFHIADLHIRRNSRTHEYVNVFNNFIKSIKENISEYRNKSVCVICGDIFHSKTVQRAEGIKIWNYFMFNLTKLIPVFVIMGNHDVDLTTNNMDWISPIDGMLKDFYYLRKSGCYTFSNIVFCVSSLIDKTIIEVDRKKYKDKKIVHLYHGTINGSKIFNNQNLESNLTIKDFGDYDYVLLGDIHKHQYLNDRVAYPSSLIQQDRGETIDKHGYILWDIENETSSFNEVQNNTCHITVDISDKEVVYDLDKLKKHNKTKLYVTYNIYEPDQTISTNKIKEFIKRIKENKMEIVLSSKDKKYTTELIKELEEYEKDDVEKYIRDYLNDKKYTQDIIEKVIELHKEMETNTNYEDDKYKSMWKMEKVVFKNIFNYGNNRENIICFNKMGFYRIFGNNHIGKSSIVNILKWGLYTNESNINEMDVLYKGNKNVNNGYIKIYFTVHDRNYILTRTLTKSKKVSGLTCNSNLQICKNNNIIGEITGNSEIKNTISSVIGTYDNYELTTSINNEDIGIMKNNSLAIFNNLFKLDKFKEMEKLAKEKLTKIKMDIKFNEGSIKTHNKNYEKQIEKIKKEISDIELKNGTIKNDTISLEKEIELDNKLIKENDIIINSINITDKDLEDKTEIIRDITDEMEKIKSFCNQYIINDVKNELKDLESNNEKLQYYNLEKIVYDNKEHEEIIMKMKEININEYKIEERNKHLCENIDKLENEISETRTNIKNVSIRDSEKMENQINDYKEQIDILNTNNINTNDKIEQYENDIKKLLEKIVQIDVDEKEIRRQVKMNNFTNIRKSILEKLKTEEELSREDRDIIIKLLTETDYCQILETVENNKNYNKEIKNKEGKIKKLKKEHKDIKKQLVSLNRNLDKVKNELVINNENIIIEENNKKYKKIIEEQQKTLKENKKEYRDNNTKLKKYLTLNTKNEQMNTTKKNYERYIEQKTYNDKIKIEKEEMKNKIIKLKEIINKYLKYENELIILENNLEINTKIQKDYDNYKKLYNDNEDQLKLKKNKINENIILQKNVDNKNKKLIKLKIESNNSDNLLKNKKTSLKELENDKKKYEGLVKEKEELENKLRIYKEYSFLVSIKGLPSMIIIQKLPLLESNINNLLDDYTNFNIKMSIKGSGNSRKINIVQIKKDIETEDEKNKSLSIKSCSGYETVMLNIVFKIVIRKLCYINECSFLCIDEVLSKISVKKYDKLINMFNMLRDNYDNILVISHIREIQNMLKENYKGIDININKDSDNISYIE